MRRAIQFTVANGKLFALPKQWNETLGRYTNVASENPKPVTLEQATALLAELEQSKDID